MAQRKPRLANAFIEVGFVVLAGVLGFLKTPWAGLGALIAVMATYWVVNRWASLGPMWKANAASTAGVALVSIALISGVLAVSFWLGRLIAP